jgi:DNA-binding response OmpR family regulator
MDLDPDPRRILILEHDAALRGELTRVFSARGYDVHPAASVAAFVHAACEEQFDACLLDLAVPDGDGLWAWNAVRGQQPQAIAVAMTARRTAEINRRAADAAVRATLQKPVDPPRLLAAFEPGMDLP